MWKPSENFHRYLLRIAPLHALHAYHEYSFEHYT